MSKVNGLTRGDVRRNARKARLREMVPVSNAVLGIDLGDKKQAMALVDRDGGVLWRRSPQVRVHELGQYLDAVANRAAREGLAGITVACEPTGARWMVVQELAARREMPFVCVQPLVSHVAREQQDLTGDKSDEGDCGLIGRLTWELHCYVPEQIDPAWAELRAAGRDRAVQITRATAAKQLIRDQLALTAPGLLEAHSDPLESATWLACLETIMDSRHGGELAAVTAMGWQAFAAAAAGRLPGWDGRRLGGSARKMFAALAGPQPVPAMLRAVRRRIAAALQDLAYARTRRARTEAEMITMLGELGIEYERVCQIPGLTPAGLAAILAETGDLHQYESSSSVVKHAGMSPARNQSADFHGKTKMSRRGRPALRLAAWRAAWAVLRHCDVLAAKHAALTSRDEGRLADAQARVACAASLLRWIYALIVHGTSWDPRIASGELRHDHAIAA